ncbi:phage late control D family protein [Pinibacter soli]|uniref:Phage protein D n=1 Tax=Pinibacter soli TaxID=3044211 RepID=A0ABT6RC15_9BACT|nr:hypothetical protein [Pinibacter soli]MDI3319996.1 hypothetical protein [Pinibacter soli]
MNLPVAEYTLVYNTKDISRDIADQVISINYTDKIGGESDTLELVLMDKDLRWQNSWYPQKGDSINLIIRQNGLQMDCGLFEVDELSLSISTSGDVFSIKGLAAGIKKPMRTKESYAHEDKSLKEIANTVANDMQLKLLGNVPAISIHRATQYRESALSFLNRIGSTYGCIFSVRGANLVFTYYKDLENRSASLTLTKQQLISLEVHDQTHKTFKACRVRHHDPLTKDVQEFTANPDDDSDSDVDSSDTLEIRGRVENKQQAEQKARYALYKNNTEGVGGDITLPGNILFVSGNNFQLNGAGNFSGIFHIMESSHSISSNGAYVTSGNIKRVKTIDSVNFKTQ